MFSGILVKQYPQNVKNAHTASQVEAEAAFYREFDRSEQIAQAEAAYPRGAAEELGVEEEHALWLWMDADWRKWEQVLVN